MNCKLLIAKSVSTKDTRPLVCIFGIYVLLYQVFNQVPILIVNISLMLELDKCFLFFVQLLDLLGAVESIKIVFRYYLRKLSFGIKYGVVKRVSNSFKKSGR